MKKFKRVLALILSVLCIVSLAACTGNTNTDESTTDQTKGDATTSSYSGEKVNVAAIKGPTGMGMTELFGDEKYNMTLIADPTQIASLITTGEVDIAACPLNLAANLYNKTNGKVKLLGINTLGVLYVVTNGGEINKLSDLSGKTVYMSGQGTTAEYIVNHVLEKNELKDSVKIEYLSEHSEVMTKLLSGDAPVVILPEPFVSVAAAKNKNVKSAISLTDEWNNIDKDTELAMGCVIVNTAFAEKNPEAVKQFIEDNKKSVENVNVNAYDGVLKMIDCGIVDEGILKVDETLKEKKAQQAKEANAAGTVSRCNIVFIDGENLKTVADGNFKVLFDANPASIGGKLPDSGIYYEAK